jgi:STE24 endopeptidase
MYPMLTLLLSLVILNYLIEAWIKVLNYQHGKKPLHPTLANLYSESEYRRSIEYSEANFKLSIANSTYSILIMVVALAFGIFGELDQYVRGLVSSEILIALIFFAILGIASDILDLPFDLYGTFIVEARFGFNKTTAKTFILDKVKGYLLGALIGGGLLALIIFIYQETGSAFWVLGWLLLTIFSLVMFMFGTTLILPLFNKLKPLEEGELKEEILNYCKQEGYSIGRLFVMDASKRSSKANAFFAGLGKSKTIVLFDTLIEKLGTREIMAVLAHEIGHYKKKHTLFGFALSTLQSLVIFAVLGWALQFPELSNALGSDIKSFHLSILAFFIIFSPLSFALDLITNGISRRNEYEADQFAKKTYDGEPLKSGLIKITTDSLANLSPHPLAVKIYASHPPLLERLNALN